MGAMNPELLTALRVASYFILISGVALGMLALLSPRWFAHACDLGSRWVSTPLQCDAIDKRGIDTNTFVVRHSRATGVVILLLSAAFASVSVLGA